MKKFFEFLKKRAFTLPEALVVIIITGYCLVPIVGTLQNSLSRSQTYNYREKLRMLARSRLNKEVANAGFDLEKVSNQIEYHYVYLDDHNPPQELSLDSASAPADFLAISTVTELIYIFKTEVEVRDQLKLENTNGAIVIPNDYKNNVSGLKAVVVKTEIQANENVVATDSISYFSLVSVPRFSDEYIYICESSNLSVNLFDPESKTLVESFQFPKIDTSKPYDDDAQNLNRPWNIEIHPSNKFLGIQSEKNLRVLNLDRTSSDYGKVAEIATFASKIADVKKDDGEKAREDRGITFSPDGKNLYFTNHTDKKIHGSFVTGWETDPITWPLTYTPKFDFTYSGASDKPRDMIAGNDGWLYVVDKDADMVIRTQMYPINPSSPVKQFVDVSGNVGAHPVAVAPDIAGQYFYVVDEKKDPASILKYRSRDLQYLGKATVTLNEKPSDMFITRDSKYLAFNDTKDATNLGGFFLLDLATTNFATTPGFNTTLPHVYPGPAKQKVLQGIAAPNDDHIVFFSEDSYLCVASVTAILAGDVDTGLSTENLIQVSADKDYIADIAARRPEYLLVGCDDNSVKYIDLNTGKLNESLELSGLTDTPECIDISPQGDRFKLGFGAARAGMDTYKTFANQTVINPNQGAANIHGVKFLATDNFNDHFLTKEIHASNNIFNGYWAPETPIPGSPPPDFRAAKDVDFTAGTWVVQDIKALNKGGFLALVKNTYSGETILDWVGVHEKSTAGRDSGHYERFARWNSTRDNFPPPNATEIAISPDDSLLAITCLGTSPDSKVAIYEFNSQNFGFRTQINGMILDYRQAGNDTSTYVGQDATFDFDTSFKERTAGRPHNKLRDAFTSLTDNAWEANFKSNPANYYKDSSGQYTLNSSRFFGYYSPTSAVNGIGFMVRDGGRFYLSNLDYTGFIDKSLNWAGGNDHQKAYSPKVDGANNPDPTTFSLIANQTKFLQVENSSTGDSNLGMGIFSSSSAETHLVNPGDWWKPGTNSSNFTKATTPAGGSCTLKACTCSGGSTFEKITNNETTAFRFRPQLMFHQDFAGNTPAETHLTWNRDTASPTLFVFTSNGDKIHYYKVGSPFVTRAVSTVDFLEGSFAVSPDNSSLIYGDTDGKKIIIRDISNSSTYLDEKFSISLGATKPKCFAVRPGYLKNIGDNYEILPNTLPTNFAGAQNAAVSDGGIYVLGGSEYAANPTLRNGAWGVANLAGADPTTTGALNKGVKLHSVVAYDGELYAFNGQVSSGITDWVQKLNPKTGIDKSSADFNATGKVSPTLTGDTSDIDCSHEQIVMGERAWEVFDGDLGTDHEWDTGGHMDGSPNYEWVSYHFSTPTVVNLLKIYPSSDDNPKDIEFKGSLDNSAWDTLTLDGNASTVLPDSASWHSYTVGNTTAYNYYKLVCKSSYDSDIEVEEMEFHFVGGVTEPYMTKTTDDENNAIKLERGATCLTPYGIMIAGGYDGSDDSDKAMIYWPQGIHKYEALASFSLGISRSLPDMPRKVRAQCLVYHKGKVYRVGGIEGSTTRSEVDVFDLEQGTWSTITPIDPGNLLVRSRFDACSWGDEIFIFGGQNSGGTTINTAAAWNPELNTVRRLKDIPHTQDQSNGATAARTFESAVVACGPNIYIIGGSTSSSAGGGNRVIRYTP